MLADELDAYKGKGNSYVDDNIWEIQDLYKEEVVKKEEGRIKEKEVILIKLSRSKIMDLVFLYFLFSF